MGLGDYPIDYDKRIHGPYDPTRYYGKVDTPFGQVKLGELGKWFARRNKSPNAIISALSRAYWRWNDKYALPRNAGITPLFHLAFGFMGVFYIINYGRIQLHRNVKYHW